MRYILKGTAKLKVRNPIDGKWNIRDFWLVQIADIHNCEPTSKLIPVGVPPKLIILQFGRHKQYGKVIPIKIYYDKEAYPKEEVEKDIVYYNLQGMTSGDKLARKYL